MSLPFYDASGAENTVPDVSVADNALAMQFDELLSVADLLMSEAVRRDAAQEELLAEVWKKLKAVYTGRIKAQKAELEPVQNRLLRHGYRRLSQQDGLLSLIQERQESQTPSVTRPPVTANGDPYTPPTSGGGQLPTPTPVPSWLLSLLQQLLGGQSGGGQKDWPLASGQSGLVRPDNAAPCPPGTEPHIYGSSTGPHAPGDVLIGPVPGSTELMLYQVCVPTGGDIPTPPGPPPVQPPPVDDTPPSPPPQLCIPICPQPQPVCPQPQPPPGQGPPEDVILPPDDEPVEFEPTPGGVVIIPPTGLPPTNGVLPIEPPPAEPVVSADRILWAPEKEDYCLTVDKVIEAVSPWGNFIRQFMATGNAGVAPGTAVANLLTNLGVPNFLAEQITSTLNNLGILRIVSHVSRIAEAFIPDPKRCSPEAAFALYCANALVGCLENMVGGWELGPQILITIRIELVQIKRVLNYLTEYVCPTSIPDSGSVQNLLLGDRITKRHAECLWRFNSDIPWFQHELTATRRGRMDALEYVRFWMRDQRDDQKPLEYLRSLGWLNESEQRDFIESQKFMPPPSDVIRFAVKDVFDPKKPGIAEMRAELEEQKDLLGLFRAQGIEDIMLLGPDGNLKKYEIPLYYWVSSYDEIPAGQAAQFYQRIFPEVVNLYPLPDGKGGFTYPKPVLFEEYKRLLKDKDINPAYRDRYAALAYDVMGKIDIKRFYQDGIFGPPKGLSGFPDKWEDMESKAGKAEKMMWYRYRLQGSSLPDAYDRAKWSALDYDRRYTGDARKKQATNICQLYQLGGMDRQQAETQAVEALGNETAGKALIAQCETDRALKKLRQAVETVRKMYFGGRADNKLARYYLTNFGITPGRINEYLALWDLQLQARSKEIAARQVKHLYDQALLFDDEAIKRLYRLGYNQVDIAKMLQSWKADIAARQLKEFLKQAKQERQEAMRLEKERKKQEADRLKRFLAAFTDSNLKDWFKKGLITVEEVADVLRLKGWSEENIGRWLTANSPEPEE